MESFHTVASPNNKQMDSLVDKTFPPELPSMNIQKFIQGADERKWNGPYTFIHAADPQFGLIEKYINKKENPRWNAEISLTRAAIKCINKMNPKPRFLVIGGDMLDAHPVGEQEINLRNEQYDDFVKVFSELDPEIPLICTCGNHDIGDDPTEESQPTCS